MPHHDAMPVRPFAFTIPLVAITRLAAADPSGPPSEVAPDVVHVPLTNLRVSVNCADYWATPERGLRLSIDGVEVAANGVDLASETVYWQGRHNTHEADVVVPTDIGYSVAPGPHHLALAAPGCSSLESELAVSAFPIAVSGRLPVSDSSLAGTVGAPNGFGFLLGGFTRSLGTRTTSASVNGTVVSIAPSSIAGGWLASTYEHRHFVLANDIQIGTTNTNGTANPPDTTGTEPYTGNILDLRFALRVGVRLPLHDVALAAGAGIGVDVLNTSGSVANDPFSTPLDDTDAEAYIPLWATATYKPSCSFGVQAYAGYDIYLGERAEDAPTFGAALVWQPSASCSEPSGLRVTGG
jgi:hypothetical protein